MLPLHASLLHAKIAAVCPIDGISLGDLNDPKTWRIDFSANATTQQMAAAQAQLAAITPQALAAADTSVQTAAAAIPDPLAAARAQAVSALPVATVQTAQTL